MTKDERKYIVEAYKQAKKNKVTRYRFAWWLIEKYPNLVVAIIKEFMKLSGDFD
jgi:hypothetical protein